MQLSLKSIHDNILTTYSLHYYLVQALKLEWQCPHTLWKKECSLRLFQIINVKAIPSDTLSLRIPLRPRGDIIPTCSDLKDDVMKLLYKISRLDWSLGKYLHFCISSLVILIVFCKSVKCSKIVNSSNNIGISLCIRVDELHLVSHDVSTVDTGNIAPVNVWTETMYLSWSRWFYIHQ